MDGVPVAAEGAAPAQRVVDVLQEQDATLSDADLSCDDAPPTSIAPGPLLTATEAADTFVIGALNVSEAGKLLDASGQPVGHTVISGFNPDDDRLILDLAGSNLVQEDGALVVLTGTVPPDGEGLMFQVNGVNVVQLSTYGGGNAQWALEDLYTDFFALDVTGAEFVFPAVTDPVTPPADPDLSDDADLGSRLR